MAIREVRSASAEHVEDMSYLVTRLQADPRAAVFAPQVKTDSAALQARNEDWNLHRHAVQEARSGVRSANESLTFVVRSVHGTILENLRHNRRSPAYLTYFPFGLTAFTRTSHEDQVTAVRALARQCAQDPSPKTREGAGLLHAAADEMVAALARRGEALVAESASYGRLQVEKLQAIQTCRRVGHRLAELYPGEWDRVRSYFRKTYRRSRAISPCPGGPAPEMATAAITTPVGAAVTPMWAAAYL